MKEDKSVLLLTLHKSAFEVMHTGEKDTEFRSDSEWFRSRILDEHGKIRKYDLVTFRNGYHKTAQEFTCKFVTAVRMKCDLTFHYSNGFSVTLDINTPTWMIILGEIVEVKNLKQANPQQYLL